MTLETETETETVTLETETETVTNCLETKTETVKTISRQAGISRLSLNIIGFDLQLIL